VWCEGYDSPVLGNPVDVIKQIVYLYTNPTKDGLVNSINEYPNLSTWNIYNTGGSKIPCIPFKRSDIPRLSSLSPTEDKILSHLESLQEPYEEKIELEIDPNAWMEVMQVPLKDWERINDRIKRIVEKTDQKFNKKRESNNQTSIGTERLISSPINLHYRSKRKGKRSYCISSQISFRVQIIKSIKALIDEGKEIYQRWKQGDHSLRFPIGIYPPSMPRLGNLMAGVIV